MRWLVIGLVVVVATALEQWSGWWWQVAGVPVPVAGLMLFGLCLSLDRKWWPWLGLVMGVTMDLVGIGVMGQYSLWWWLGMCGAWWLDAQLESSQWRGWLLAVYVAGLIGLLPLYETAWVGVWQGWWPDLMVVCAIRVSLFLLIACPLYWFFKRNKVIINQS